MQKKNLLSLSCALFLLAGQQESHAMGLFTHMHDTELYTTAAESLSPESRPVTINNYYTTGTQKSVGQRVRTAVKVTGGAALILLGLRYGKPFATYATNLFKVPTRVYNIQQRLVTIEKNMATKEQCEVLRAKLAELRACVATKDDLQTLATKHDVSPLATKAQVAALADLMESILPKA